MEVYITKANADRIVAQMDLSDMDIYEFKQQMAFKWFNNGELRKLKAFEMFFSDPELFSSQYVRISPRETNSKFVFKGSNPAFHDSESCERLLSDFKNILVPKEIEEAGRMKEYIKWCEENKELFGKYPDQFRYKLKTKFGLSIDPYVQHENSGYEAFDNFTLEELEKAIDKKIREAKNFYNSSVEHELIITTLGNQSFNYKNPNKLKIPFEVSEEEVVEILKTLEIDYKQPLMRMLKTYYRIKNNHELKFDSDTLSALGFNPCACCCMALTKTFFAA